MAAHIYWRVLITRAFGGTAFHVAIEELEFFDAAGALLSTGGTPTASSFFQSNPTYAADKAFDNNYATFWHSANMPSSGAPEWIRYQFAGPVDVAVIRMTWREDTLNQAPGTFTIQYSDDNSAWTTAAGPYTPGWLSAFIVSLSFAVAATPGYCNYRAVVNSIQGTAQGNQASGAEVEFRETAGGANLASSNQRHAIYSDDFLNVKSNDGRYAFDRNIGTFWRSNNAPPGPWIGNAMSRKFVVAEVAWRARNDISYIQSPVSFKLQGSNDGAAWVDVWNCNFGAWTAAGQIQTCAAPSTQQPMVTVA